MLVGLPFCTRRYSLILFDQAVDRHSRWLLQLFVVQHVAEPCLFSSSIDCRKAHWREHAHGGGSSSSVVRGQATHTVDSRARFGAAVTVTVGTFGAGIVGAIGIGIGIGVGAGAHTTVGSVAATDALQHLIERLVEQWRKRAHHHGREVGEAAGGRRRKGGRGDACRACGHLKRAGAQAGA